jgi:hypothetical protein
MPTICAAAELLRAQKSLQRAGQLLMFRWTSSVLQREYDSKIKADVAAQGNLLTYKHNQSAQHAHCLIGCASASTQNSLLS